MASEIMSAINRMLNKIESANIVSVNAVGQHVQEEFKKLVEREVYDAYSPKTTSEDWGGRTGALRLSPTIVSVGANGVKVEFADNGNWTSWSTGKHFYALYGLEGGYTRGRPPSNIMREVTSGSFQSGIADEYQDTMKAQGIPIIRK